MAKKCDILGTGVMSGNNVSHANNKTRRRFLPNLQVVSLFSEALNRVFKLKVCSKTLRSIEHNGGLDSYLEKIDGMRYPVNRAYLTLVALDEDNKPRRVPRLKLETVVEEAEWETGKKRSELRKQRKKEGF